MTRRFLIVSMRVSARSTIAGSSCPASSASSGSPSAAVISACSARSRTSSRYASTTGSVAAFLIESSRTLRWSPMTSGSASEASASRCCSSSMRRRSARALGMSGKASGTG
ncbi:MAG: hypothetical protein EA423_06080 [Phycisphaerales bacterium]|nr:MAG: hypothetical protein EA423_06080 [Phycisphaerales bacterium]